MRRVIMSDGCAIAVSDAGSGPAILFIPGLGGSGAFWSDIVPDFHPGFRTLVVDHRGAGGSDRPDMAYSIDLLAADMIGVLDRLGIPAAHVVGHSTGGVIAQTLAIDHPRRVERLVISGSWDAPDARFRLMFETRLQILLAAGPSVYQNLTHALGFPASWLETHREELESAVENAAVSLSPIAVAAERIRMLLTAGRADDLGRIGAKTLVVGAPDDALIPFSHSERLAAAIPGAELAAIEGAHFYPRVHPQRFAALVRRFLET